VVSFPKVPAKPAQDISPEDPEELVLTGRLEEFPDPYHEPDELLLSGPLVALPKPAPLLVAPARPGVMPVRPPSPVAKPPMPDHLLPSFLRKR
jgi:hypothetical protein